MSNTILYQCTITKEKPQLPKEFSAQLNETVYLDPFKEPILLRTESDQQQLISSFNPHSPKLRLLQRYYLADLMHCDAREAGAALLQRRKWRQATLEITRDEAHPQYILTVTDQIEEDR